MSHMYALILDAQPLPSAQPAAPVHSDVIAPKTPVIASEAYINMLPDTRHTGIVGNVYSEYGYVSWPQEKRDIRFTPRGTTLKRGDRVTYKINHITMRAYDLQREGQEVIKPSAPRRESPIEAFKRRKAMNEAARAAEQTRTLCTPLNEGMYASEDAYDDIEPTF